MTMVYTSTYPPAAAAAAAPTTTMQTSVSASPSETTQSPVLQTANAAAYEKGSWVAVALAAGAAVLA